MPNEGPDLRAETACLLRTNDMTLAELGVDSLGSKLLAVENKNQAGQSVCDHLAALLHKVFSSR